MSSFWLILFSSRILYNGTNCAGFDESCVPTKITWRCARPKKHVTFALSEQKLACPAHTRELDEDEDDEPLVRPDRTVVSEEEDDQPLMQRASREEPAEEKRESVAERRVHAPVRTRKRASVWRDPSTTLEQDLLGHS